MRASAAVEPKSGRRYATIGVAKIFIGRAAETETHVQEALRLSPRDSNAFRWLHCVGVSYDGARHRFVP